MALQVMYNLRDFCWTHIALQRVVTGTTILSESLICRAETKQVGNLTDGTSLHSSQFPRHYDLV